MPKVAFLGPQGTYTHQFSIEDLEIYPETSISDCFHAINDKKVDYAVVPFENSTNGQVVFTYDLLRDWFMSELQGKADFKVVAEQFVSINHYFLSYANLSAIKTVYSHPQVWGQVTNFLNKEEIKQLELTRVDTTSTSKAAELVAADDTKTSACISSKTSAEMYKIPALYERIEDNSNNTTRFLVLGYKDFPADANLDRITSLMFTVSHDPGALCKALDCFRQNNVNLTSINSRPSHVRPWHYVFFIELMGDTKQEEVSASLQQLQTNCLDLVVLGSFNRSWRYQ